MICIVDKLWTLLKEEFRDNLRVVTYYNETEFETKMRSDIRSAYSGEGDEKIVEEVSLNGLHVPHLEDLFKAGEFGSNIFVFEEAHVVHLPVDEKRGLIVSIEPDNHLSSLSVIENSISQVELLSPEASAANNPSCP